MSSEGTIFLTARGLAVRIGKRRLYSQVTHPLPACTSQLIHASRSLDARVRATQSPGSRVHQTKKRTDLRWLFFVSLVMFWLYWLYLKLSFSFQIDQKITRHKNKVFYIFLYFIFFVYLVLRVKKLCSEMLVLGVEIPEM